MHWSAAMGVVLVGSVVSAPVFAAEEEELPAIRDLDIATIESLASAMYAQDQLAWKATDVVLAERGQDGMEDDGVRGWITVEGDTADTVRFIHPGDDGPEVLYDVIFAEGQEPALYAPATPVLTPEELAQYNARMLALENIETPCSETYNTVALKEPGSDNWLVWAMASTTEPNVAVTGGHYRFTISADGSEIEQADRLFRGCMELSQRDAPEGQNAFASTSHVVSLTPVETHLFANLYHPFFRYVGTMDGTAWKMEGGRLSTVQDDSPEADGAAARFMAGMGESCAYMLTDPTEDPQRYYVAGQGQGKVILETENEETYTSPNFEERMEMLSIVCSRMDIVPALNDYKILKAGYTLLISDGGEGHTERRGDLALVDGVVQFTLNDESEALTPELQARMDARLAHFQEMLRQP